MKNKTTNFVLDTNLKKLNEEVDTLIFNLKNPLSGERVNLIKSFTKELIKAYSNQEEYKILKQPPKEALIISTTQETPQEQDFVLPSEETLDFEIPNYPLEPERDLSHETFNILPRSFGERPPQPLPQPVMPVAKPEPQKIEIKEERINLVTTKTTGEEMAYASRKGLFYIIDEAPLTEQDKLMLNTLKPILEKRQELFQNEKKFIKILKKTSKKNKLNLEELHIAKLRYYLIKHIINFGLIDPFFHDPKITKIICDGPNTKLKIIRESEELITNIEFHNKEKLSSFIQSLARKASTKISEESPTLDVTFENFRIHATLGTEEIPSKFVMEKTI
jgi:hypothetical protein